MQDAPVSFSLPRSLAKRRAALASVIVTAGLLILALAACSPSTQPDETGSEGRERASEGRQQSERRAKRSGWNQRPGGAGQEAPAVPVIVARPKTETMRAFLDASATLRAEAYVDVVSEATGVVVELFVEEGDAVEEGQELARLAYEELELAVRRAQNEVDRLESEYRRNEALAREKLISEDVFQRLKFDLEGAQIDLEQRRLELARTKISAPISGTVTQRDVNIGTLVRANEALFSILDFASIVAPVHLPERYLRDLEVGQEAKVQPAGHDEHWLKARVTRISPVVDSESGTFEVLITPHRLRGLRPGMFAKVQLTLDEHTDVTTVEKRSLVYDDERPYLFMVNDVGRAVKIPVSLGYQGDESIEITSKLPDHDFIVVVGQSALKDGHRIVAETEDGRPVTFAAEEEAEIPATSKASTEEAEGEDRPADSGRTEGS